MLVEQLAERVREHGPFVGESMGGHSERVAFCAAVACALESERVLATTSASRLFWAEVAMAARDHYNFA